MQSRVPRLFFAKRGLKKAGLWERAPGLIPHRFHPLLKRLAFRPQKALTMEPDDRARLVAFYRDDILKLAELLNRDLSAWLDERG